MPAIIIGIITFSLSFLGVFIGKKFGNYFKKIGVLGGVLLIVIATRILLEHLEVLIYFKNKKIKLKNSSAQTQC